MSRRRTALAVALLAAFLGGCAADPPAPSPAPDRPSPSQPPARPEVVDEVTRILVLGDSVTLAVNACPADDRICAEASWATGGAEVDSLARRVDAQHPGASVASLARDGARLSTALDNLDRVLAEDPELVIVFLGANDACAPSLAEMTEPVAFRDQLVRLLDALEERSNPRVLVVEVPDLENVWEQSHRNRKAVRVWGSTPACRSLLADADDTGPTGEARRARVSERVAEFNAAIRAVCAERPRCTTDGGAVHDYPFHSSDLSAIDFFHPSEDGQRVIAELIWNALADVPPGDAG